MGDAIVYSFAGLTAVWPEFFIEALELRLNGCTGGEERGRGALLSALTV